MGRCRLPYFFAHLTTSRLRSKLKAQPCYLRGKDDRPFPEKVVPVGHTLAGTPNLSVRFVGKKFGAVPSCETLTTCVRETSKRGKTMLDSFYRDTVAEIDLDAVAHNVRAFRAWLPPRTAIMATVKANGYGHGAEPVAREALDNGATFLGVATLDEAIELQDAGIRAPILVMGYIPVRGLAEAIARKIRITVYDPDHAAQVKEASAAVGKRGRRTPESRHGNGEVGGPVT